MNMKIPQALGDLINVLNQNMQAGVDDVADYINALREPAKQLIALYVAQVSAPKTVLPSSSGSP